MVLTERIAHIRCGARIKRGVHIEHIECIATIDHIAFCNIHATSADIPTACRYADSPPIFREGYPIESVAVQNQYDEQ